MEANQTWIGLADSKTELEAMNEINQPNQILVQKTASDILTYIIHDMKLVVESLVIHLTLKQSHTDARLARGINEDGIIAPDFGKPFTGLFFDTITVKVKPIGEETKDKVKFLTRYLEGLIIHYFIILRSDYSNWELSHRNRKAAPHSNMAARHMNYPKIIIQFA